MKIKELSKKRETYFVIDKTCFYIYVAKQRHRKKNELFISFRLRMEHNFGN